MHADNVCNGDFVYLSFSTSGIGTFNFFCFTINWTDLGITAVERCFHIPSDEHYSPLPSPAASLPRTIVAAPQPSLEYEQAVQITVRLRNTNDITGTYWLISFSKLITIHIQILTER